MPKLEFALLGTTYDATKLHFSTTRKTSVQGTPTSSFVAGELMVEFRLDDKTDAYNEKIKPHAKIDSADVTIYKKDEDAEDIKITLKNFHISKYEEILDTTSERPGVVRCWCSAETVDFLGSELHRLGSTPHIDSL